MFQQKYLPTFFNTLIILLFRVNLKSWIMGIFRRGDHCLNCQEPLDKDQNYCPVCGQKNTTNNVLLGTLLRDYFGEAFSLDSRLLKSVIPFFIKPGYLTSQFNAGRRVSFINPVRLYLAMSLFYFFALSLSLTKSFNLEQALQSSSSITAQPDSLVIDSLQIMIEEQVPLDSLSRQLVQEAIDTSTVVNRNTIDQYVDYLKDAEISDQQLLDSLGLSATPSNLRFAQQVRKIVRKDLDVFIPFLLQNVPIMMLLLLPIFALILKVLYIRRKVLYIRHLVHALYLHSFAYLIYGVAALLLAYAGFSSGVNGWIFFLGLSGSIGSYLLVFSHRIPTRMVQDFDQVWLGRTYLLFFLNAFRNWRVCTVLPTLLEIRFAGVSTDGF